jgi:hypothetical protein
MDNTIINLDAIINSKKTGNELVIGDRKYRTIVDFWKWAYSDLIGNTERGAVAEYLVAIACDTEDKVRISWDSYDIQLKNGLRIEVKSSAYLQTWKQKKLSSPVFNIPKTFNWDHINNEYGLEKKRQADIYVFALLAHLDKDSLNPLDTRQWEFYIINTDILNKQIEDSKQITLKKLIEINSIKCTFEELYERILESKSSTAP